MLTVRRRQRKPQARVPHGTARPGPRTSLFEIIERRGEGVRIILENSERLSGRRPVYRLLDDAELMLTIYAANGAGGARRHRPRR